MHARDRDRRRRFADRLVSASEERYRQAANEARLALAALQVADRSKTDFLSRMSHELRTPLNAILGYIQLLDLGILGAITPEQHVHLNRVRQSAVHLLGLVNEILDLVTLENAQLRVSRQVGRLGEVCEVALTLVRIEAALRHLTLAGLPVDEPGATYLGDPDRVRQVLVHLLTNAVKFTPPGGRVTLSCGTSSEGESEPGAPSPGSWAYVRVTDSGPGIAPEQLTRIFEAFTQIDGGLTRAQEGAGLGLTVSRRLARAMGGDVTVRSDAQQGAAFTLWLPTPDSLAEPRPSNNADAADAASSSAAEIEGGRPRRQPPAVDAPAAPDVLSSSSYQRLTALGTILATEIEPVVQQHVARLRADRSLPNVERLSDAQLRDHLSTLVNEIAHVLRVTGETEARAPEMLRDGSEILRLVSELHGGQRERLDWDEEHVAREVELLHEEIEARLRHAASLESTDVNALEQAMLLVQRLLERSRQASSRGFRVARRIRTSQ
jgi:signal transduction histidine kinase